MLEGETLADRLAHTNGPLPLDEALRIADRNRRRARRGAPRGHRPPRSEAGQRHADQSRARSCSISVWRRRHEPSPSTPDCRCCRHDAAEHDGAGHDSRHVPLHGARADRRAARPTRAAIIWAFGCVLLEMLTGAPAFEGKTQAGLMAAILEREPAAIGTTPSSAVRSEPPRSNRPALSQQRPGRRWQSARDLRLELEWARTGRQPPPKPAPPTPARAALNFGLIALTLASVIVAAPEPGVLSIAVVTARRRCR